MKIAIDDIKASPKDLSYTEEVGALNETLGRGVRDYRFTDGIGVDVQYYRSGLDVFFQGSLHGRVTASCARCAEEFVFALDHPFVFVLAPDKHWIYPEQMPATITRHGGGRVDQLLQHLRARSTVPLGQRIVARCT